MTAADTAHNKPRKRMSTTAKVFLILLALLFVVVAGFIFSAWRELNRITPAATNPTATPAQVEVLTPTGATQNVPLFVPGSNNTAATASAPVSRTTPATANKPNNTTTTNNAQNTAETPILPINTPATKPTSTERAAADKPAAAAKPAPEKPAAKPKSTLDNLF